MDGIQDLCNHKLAGGPAKEHFQQRCQIHIIFTPIAPAKAGLVPKNACNRLHVHTASHA